MSQSRCLQLLLLLLILVIITACQPSYLGDIIGVSRDGGLKIDAQLEEGRLSDLMTSEKLKNGMVSIDSGDLPAIRINLCALGDIMAHEGTYKAAQVGNTYDFDYMFADFVPYTEDADYIVANLETVFAGADRTYATYPAFNTPEQMGESLARVLGVDLLSTANNHSLDRGLSGLATTLDYLDSFGIAHTGTNRNEEEREELFIAEVGGARIAFLSYTYGLNGQTPNGYSVNIISKEALQRDAAKAREEGADFIVALLHWGNEYQNKPSKTQKDLAKWLFENTEIDLIVGNHPHVTQTIEEFRVAFDGREKVGYVLYALGNFTSEQLFEYSNTGIAANIHIVIDRYDYRKNYVEEITYTPLFVDPNPKTTGKRYRVIGIREAVMNYEAGTDALISAKEYRQLTDYLEYYQEHLCTLDIVREHTLS